MSIPDFVPIFDIEMFDGISIELAFQAELLNTDGTHQDPVAYWDLTDKNVVLIINDLFPERFELSSENGDNDNGSIITIDDDPTIGKFQWSLSSVETARATKLVGYYHILLRQDDAEDEVLFRGTWKVIPFSAGGEL